MGKWYGIISNDRRKRVIKRIPQYYPTSPIQHRVRLLESFTLDKLIKLAWNIGVTNPEGMNNETFQLEDARDRSTYITFATGWRACPKRVMANYIWNRLVEIDRFV
jgi:hypothetical protein